MEVILLENIRNLGDLGEKVKVKAGYGRNYLLPLGHAIPATGDNLKKFEERRAELEKLAAERLAKANERKEAAANLQIAIASRAGDEGKLYGSIGVKEIADSIIAAGFEVEKREINLLDGPIRVVGEHEVNLQFHPEVEITISVCVSEEE